MVAKSKIHFPLSGPGTKVVSVLDNAISDAGSILSWGRILTYKDRGAIQEIFLHNMAWNLFNPSEVPILKQQITPWHIPWAQYSNSYCKSSCCAIFKVKYPKRYQNCFIYA